MTGPLLFLSWGIVVRENALSAALKRETCLRRILMSAARVARAVREIGLTHTVVTSVTRDDLMDGGAGIFARTIIEIKKLQPESMVEVLIPDLKGSMESLSVILNASPEILGHNVETIPRLYPLTRGQANYKRSLKVLGMAKELSPSTATKSGLSWAWVKKKTGF